MIRNAVLILALASLLGIGCDGRNTSVDGPNFVGFGYTVGNFEGDWSGTFNIADFEVFETIRIEIDAEGEIVDGLESRYQAVTSGDFYLDDAATGELHFNFRLEDNTRVQGIGIFEPEGGAIVGGYASDIGAIGEFRLVRSKGEGQFTTAMAAGSHTLTVVDLDTDDLSSGTLELDADGAVQEGSELDGATIVDGEMKILDDEKGDVAFTLELENGDLLVLIGIYSLADDRSAGTMTTLFPSTNGLFLLRPASEDDEAEDDEGL